MLTEPSGSAPHAVVVGHPVEHSLSPPLHRAAWAELGLTGGSYERVDVAPGELPDAVSRLARDRGVSGVSVTMPHKEAALALGRSGHGTTQVAELAGGANTLVRRDGQWWADNTDVPALARVVDRALAFRGREAAQGPTVLLGSGATGRSALVALHRCGVRAVTVVVRDAVRPEFAVLADVLGVEVRTERLGGLADLLGDQTLAGALVVSTLPVGWWDAAGTPQAPQDVTWVDALYAQWPHPWAAAAQEAGGHVVSGLHMLVEQAVDQVELMTGLRPTVQGTAALLPDDLRALHRL